MDESLCAVKEIKETEDVFVVLEYLKKGWLLYRVQSHQDRFIFLLFRI